MIEIKNLHVSIETETDDKKERKQILKGLTLTVKQGELHALMGPNGTGKSTLGFVLAGHPKYSVDQGQILLDGKDLVTMSPEERAKNGLFLAFQHPLEIPGVSLGHFLFTLFRNKNPKAPPIEFKKKLSTALELLQLPSTITDRQLNVGMSGGEKKRVEILQLLMLQPSFAVLDETDSGLDIDSLKIVANAVNTLRSPEFGCLVVTHYSRILDYLKPDVVHVMVDGSIAISGNSSLPEELEKKGYDWLKEVA